MGRRQYKKYTKEFRNQAVELAEGLGSVSEAARKLGMSNVTLHKWVTERREQIEGPKQAATVPVESPEEELKRLRRENGELKKANQILKAAAAFFSQDHLK